MTRHRNGQVDVELEVLADGLVDREAVIGLAIEVLAEVVEHKEENRPGRRTCDSVTNSQAGKRARDASVKAIFFLVRRGNRGPTR